MAKRLGYHNMSFQCADLRVYQPPKNVTAVISLHACDIATDLALATALRARAKYIACVPCCHKELLDQYTMPGLEPLTRHGVFKARFNDVLTDSMRALKLEAEGYKVGRRVHLAARHAEKPAHPCRPHRPRKPSCEVGLRGCAPHTRHNF